eukprot:CAMPEP_0174714486 /NCGR_PEP_ID=MMETSP1094-20130205/18136_1 /TAXON_ID=156173 /ORGANISM="Chrysochromulina brevifilum, Strain UTEX LB 985" /LENGTH=53 /DNA_ID=CAMNT_0015913853 /DNA_START=13 /DNA_END=170 /DNA_ORIENTATION=-
MISNSLSGAVSAGGLHRAFYQTCASRTHSHLTVVHCMLQVTGALDPTLDYRIA